MQHIKKKPTQFNHKIHCFCSRRFPWLGQGPRQTGPGGRRWMEGEVSSICPPQEPSQDTGSREPREQPWAGQVFLLVTAVQVEVPQPAPGPGPGGSSQDRNTASTWLTRYQCTHVAISFHLVRTTGSNPTTVPQNHRDGLFRTPVPWETLIQKVWVETGYVLCKKHHG